MRPGGAVQAIGGTPLAPLADGLGAHRVALGQGTGGLAGAGDLGADGGRGAGVRMDPQPGSFSSRRPGAQALEAMGVLYDRQPDRVPTMLRDQTA